MADQANRTNDDDKRSIEDGTEEKRAAARKFTRRRFLSASAGVGAGLFVLGLGGFGCSHREEDAHLEGSRTGLEVFRQGYPRALFFRQSETEARGGKFSYEEWEKRYLALNGIVGKVLDETNEHAGKQDNLPFFL